MADPSQTVPNGTTSSAFLNNLSQNQNQTGAQNQFSQFTPQQLALQQQVSGGMGNFLQGNIPTNFTAPQSVLTAYQQQFQNQVAPGLAAQYGAGSPQIASQQNQGLTSLLGNLYQTGTSNYGNALNSAGSYAMNPIGQAQQTTGTQQANQNGANLGVQGQGLDPVTLATFLAGLMGNIL